MLTAALLTAAVIGGHPPAPLTVTVVAMTGVAATSPTKKAKQLLVDCRIMYL